MHHTTNSTFHAVHVKWLFHRGVGMYVISFRSCTSYIWRDRRNSSEASMSVADYSAKLQTFAFTWEMLPLCQPARWNKLHIQFGVTTLKLCHQVKRTYMRVKLIHTFIICITAVEKFTSVWNTSSFQICTLRLYALHWRLWSFIPESVFVPGQLKCISS